MVYRSTFVGFVSVSAGLGFCVFTPWLAAVDFTTGLTLDDVSDEAFAALKPIYEERGAIDVDGSTVTVRAEGNTIYYDYVNTDFSCAEIGAVVDATNAQLEEYRVAGGTKSTYSLVSCGEISGGGGESSNDYQKTLELVSQDYPDAVDVGNYWCYSPIYGYFNVRNYPWAYSDALGFYYNVTGNGGVYCWVSDRDAWFWTSDELFPLAVNLDSGEWIDLN